jgi:hypothetical protein
MGKKKAKGLICFDTSLVVERLGWRHIEASEGMESFLTNQLASRAEKRS